ncbi:MAG: hypothetical protein AAGN66_02540 [Acidobacteriota bacterium]
MTTLATEARKPETHKPEALKPEAQAADEDANAYLRDLRRETPMGFLKFMLAMPMAGHRSAASQEALAVARLVAVQHEDCGPCVQICVDMALGAGVDPQLLRDVLAGRVDALPEPLGAVYRLADAVVTASDRATALSDEVAGALGRGALADLGLAIASSRMFPTLKRTLGYARSCSVVRVKIEA